MPHADWTTLTEDQQLALSREALRRAAETLADHAEVLAVEMDQGTLADRGGPDALRLFAAVIRATNRDAFGPVGQA
jgi:Mor family transcriptional regulator